MEKYAIVINRAIVTRWYSDVVDAQHELNWSDIVTNGAYSAMPGERTIAILMENYKQC